METLLISGNCQRYAIAAQLSQWFPAWKIRTFDTSTSLKPGAEVENLHKQLEDATLWIALGQSAALQDIQPSLKAPGVKVVRVPELGFAAYHPDVCFVQYQHSGQRPKHLFHSAIVAWAYRKGCSIEETSQLFNAATFKSLGYFDAWKDSVTYLRRVFQASDLVDDFEEFFFFVKRQGCFMYTFNHPRTYAISQLCRLLCNKLLLQPPTNFNLQAAETALAATQWPVYPEIAARLGEGSGSYHWIYNYKIIDSLSQFVDEAFEDYRQSGIAPHNLVLVNRDMGLFDRVLNQTRG